MTARSLTTLLALALTCLPAAAQEESVTLGGMAFPDTDNCDKNMKGKDCVLTFSIEGDAAKLTPQAAVASMTTGRRFGGPDAAAHGIVDQTAAEGGVTAAATDLLRPLGGKDSGTLGAIKQVMFGPAVQALQNP